MAITRRGKRQDATLINIDSLKRRITRLEVRLARLQARVTRLTTTGQRRA